MLSIYPLKSAKEAATYYEADNYYNASSEKKEGTTQWWGEGAKAFGLEGEVEPVMFETLLEGKLPHGQQLGRTQDGKIDHRPGIDLTFSAPKSVSILAEIGRDQRLLVAHDKAVNEALTYLQQHAAQARVTEDGHTDFEKTDNLLIAKFRHDLSRECDPQLHTHAVILNATKCQDEKWRSLSCELFFEKKMLAGLIYRSVLAHEITRLGYDIQKTEADGRFEIAGVPKDLIEHFSKRRDAIEKAMQHYGLKGAKAAEKATLFTRDRKKSVNRNALQEQWKEECEAHGFDIPHFMARSLERFKEGIPALSPETHEALAHQAVQYATAHLAEREAVFPHDTLLKITLAYGLGKLLLPDIESAITTAEKNQTLMAIQREGKPKGWTTPETMKQEQGTLNTMLDGRFQLRPMATPQMVDTFLAQIPRLNESQQDALKMMLTSSDRFVGIQGYAGVGKTTLLSALKAFADKQGVEIKGLAANAVAVSQLYEEAGIESMTLDSYLIQHAKEGRYCKSRSHTLYVLDEASAVSTPRMADFLKAVSRTKARGVLVGDVQQLGSVEWGKIFDQLQKAGMKTAIMKTILRQKNPDLLEAVYSTIQGDIQRALKKIGDHVYECPDRHQRLRQLVSDYLALTPEEREKTLVLFPANEDRREVNRLIREGLTTEKTLHGEEVACTILVKRDLTRAEVSHAMHYRIGDDIRFNKKEVSLGVKAGDYAEVVVLDMANNAITLKNAKGILTKWHPYSSTRQKKDAIEVYEKEERGLRIGDTLRWSRNDRDRGLVNSGIIRVIAVNAQTATVQSEKGQRFPITLAKQAHQHWEYAYASTAHAAQGKTCDRVLAHGESFRINLTNQHGFYVMISRARHHAYLYVDDKDAYLKTLKQYVGDKTSALEEIARSQAEAKGKIDFAKLAEKKCLPPLVSSTHTFSSQPKMSLDREAIYAALTARTEGWVKHLLGEPNPKLSSSQQWRYGNKGSLHLQLQGEYRGCWYNFETGEGGHLLQLCERLHHVSFKEAMVLGSQWLRLTPEHFPTIPSVKAFSKASHREPQKRHPLDQRAIDHARTLVKQSRPIQHTLAERYLREHRGITHPLNDHFRFHPALREPMSQKFYPALLVIAQNKNNQTEAVQVIYLDRHTGKKAEMDQPKRIYGRMRFGAKVIVNQGKGSLLIAEGVETALSIAQARPDAMVIASLSASNLAHIELSPEKKAIVLCADNDGEHAKTHRSLQKAIDRWVGEGRTVSMAMPPTTLEKDFNDVHRAKGIQTVKEILQKATPVQENSLQLQLSSPRENALKLVEKAMRGERENDI